MAIEYINTTFLSRSTLPVYTTKVESPTLFWVQLQYNRPSIQELEEELTWFMRKKAKIYTFFAHAVAMGSTVAVKHDKIWRRGQIVLIKYPFVTIHLGDWGWKIRRSIYHLHHLPEQFYRMFWQAIPCGIYGIKPTHGNTRWSLSVRAVTKHLAEHKEGWMCILQTIVSRSAYVELDIATPGILGANRLKTELVKRKCAELAPNTNLRPYPSISHVPCQTVF